MTARRKTDRPYRAWAPQLVLLRHLVGRGHSLKEIGRRLDRNPAAVWLKCRQLGLETEGRTGRPRKPVTS